VACVVSPVGGDAQLAVDFLAQAGIESRGLLSLREVPAALDERIGCLVLVEEALISEEVAMLRELLAALPAWRDLPLILVSRDFDAIGEVAGVFPTSGNVTLLDRPLSPHTLVSAVQVALRAAARQREVAALIDEREQAVKLRDEFLAMLAHELRNPLAPMRNALYLMRRRRDDEAMVQKSTEILDRQISHVVRMVDDLMDVARLERGKVVLRRQRIDMNTVVRSAVESCLEAAREMTRRVQLDLAPVHLDVDADAVRMEQVVCNLVNNALKFSRGASDVRIHTLARAGQACVVVSDEGVGFPPDAGERLFDPFLQVNPTIERSAGGLGMGLTIVRRLMELHGGTVRASSPGPGRGARFEACIPLAAPQAPAVDQRRDREAAVHGARRRVVVVEDSPDIRDTLSLLIGMWGHEVSLASDGRSGMELVLRERPDVALIDVGLPLMNGYDVARAIRRSFNGPIRLIAVTGYGQPADRELAREAGFDSHLLKPIAPEYLERLLAQ
jgi:signal transduction histidine kinase